ncbi:hypothetical protein CY35_13G117000 [Sphagnum magellanicum]|nr:hypothetical protein CY35_13G117000 [Sphagnum magellanicum]
MLDEDDKTLFLFVCLLCVWEDKKVVLWSFVTILFVFYKVFFRCALFRCMSVVKVVTEAVENTYATVVVVQKYSRTKRSLDYVRRIGRRRRRRRIRSRRITTRFLCVCCRILNLDILRNRRRLQKSFGGKLHQEADLSRSSGKSCDAALLKRKPASIKATVSITEAVFLCWPEFDNA